MDKKFAATLWLAVAVAIVLALVGAVGDAGAQEIPVDVLDTPEVRIEVEHIEQSDVHQTFWLRVRPRQGETGVTVEVWPFDVQFDYVEVDADGAFTDDWTLSGNLDPDAPARLTVAEQAGEEIFLHVELAPVDGPTRLLVSAGGQALESWANVPDRRPDEHPRWPGMRYVETAEMGLDVWLDNPHALPGQEAELTAFGYPYGGSDAASLTLHLRRGWELVGYECGMHAVCGPVGEYDVFVERVGGTGDEAWLGMKVTLRATEAFGRHAAVEFAVGDGGRGVDNHIVLRDSAYGAFLPIMLR